MQKLEIKNIKGKKYLYIKYKDEVNNKNISKLLYVGRFEKLTISDFMAKLNKLHIIRLTNFIDSWTNKSHQYLDNKKIHRLELIHYNYLLFKSQFPDELKIYNNSVFAHYVQGTTAIEGNTITQKQANELLEHGVTPAGKSLREVYEIVNFKKLAEFLVNFEGDLSEKTIQKIHAMIMEQLLESAGDYRRIQILIEKAEHEPPPAFEIPELMKQLTGWYRQHRKNMHPFELALLLHTKFVTIHPFVDGNGRVARALLNFVLEKNDYPKLYIGLEDRNAYLDAVAEGNKGNYQPVVDFMYYIYLRQHELIKVNNDTRFTSENINEFPEMNDLLNQFLKLSYN
ncbi:MAG: Fic family protein [ANME-2 cluster archaeon]|nr:Fic family protein [ANME-2 cluster archaeon]